MPDVEKVIYDLEQCLDDSIAAVVPADTVRDALALLKAQEPMVMAGAELTDAELIEEIRKAPLALKPNVYTIPVEWLRKWPKSFREGAYVHDILTDWKKEQEAR